MTTSTKSIITGIIIGVSLIISTIIASVVFYSTRSEGALSVTGSARQSVVADQVKWTGNWSRVVSVKNLKDGYAIMEKDEKAVRDFLISKNINSAEITVKPVFMDQIYNYGDKNPSSTEREYNLNQSVQITSNDVEKITDLAKSTKAIVDKGVIFSSYNPEYTFTKLADLRVSLLGNAIKDAMARANMIANAGGKKVNTLTSAASGVVQVLPEGSVDVSDYGTYDTSSQKKEVMVTVKASFTLK
ncbi:MAG: SIMPL domain-containing protein [bacterium]|nr:SIMPL domain-containing protein [bacterium]